MVEVFHVASNGYGFTQTTEDPLTRKVGYIVATDAVGLIKGLWPLLSKLEQQDVMESIMPMEYCTIDEHAPVNEVTGL